MAAMPRTKREYPEPVRKARRKAGLAWNALRIAHRNVDAKRRRLAATEAAAVAAGVEYELLAREAWRVSVSEGVNPGRYCESGNAEDAVARL